MYRRKALLGSTWNAILEPISDAPSTTVTPTASVRRPMPEITPAKTIATTAVSSAAAITTYGIRSPPYSERKSPFLAAEMTVVLAVFRKRNAAITPRGRPSASRRLSARVILLKMEA